jgi:hypothetical protein
MAMPRGRRSRARPLFVALLAAVLPLLGATGAHAATDGSRWSIVPLTHWGTVTGLSGISSSDLWAVGYFYDQYQGRYRPLTEHWNGTKFRFISAPTATHGYNAFNAVTEVAPRDVWAVGYHTPVYYTYDWTPLIEHYDGTRWRVVSSPYRNLGTLTAIAAVSATDVWAVGYRTINPYGTLIEHWDGVRWSLLDDGHSADNSQFNGIVVKGPDDVWAGGSTQVGSANVAFAEHWNGSAWTESIARNEQEYDVFNAIADDHAGGLWGAGWQTPGLGYRQMGQHFDGNGWTMDRLPYVGAPNNNLYGVTSLGSQAWQVGYAKARPLIEHWNGSRWRVESNPARAGGVLYAIATVGSQIWVGGDSLIMRRDV